MFDWIEEHQGILWTIGTASVVIIVASVLVVPALVARIRPDYFAHDVRPPSRWADHHPMVKLLVRVGKNILGYLFIVAGLAMFVLPGQGLLTLLVGVLLIDVRGKYRFEKWLISRRFVCGPINWLRRRAGREPLQVVRS